jgi:phage shock protein B
MPPEVVLVVFIVFGSVVCVFAILGWVIVRLTKGKHSSQSSNAEESQMMQEIFHGLSRMEKRVETLETLLMEREARGDKS